MCSLLTLLTLGLGYQTNLKLFLKLPSYQKSKVYKLISFVKNQKPKGVGRLNHNG